MDEQTFETTLASIRADRERGASELARECLAVMAETARHTLAKDEAELNGLLHRRAECLAQARPSMAPIYNLLQRWLTLFNNERDVGLGTARVQAARLADELIEYSLRAVGETARQLASHLGPDRTLMTHSLSSTVLAVFRGLHGQGLKAIITESRPLYEGRLLAKRLSDWHVPTTLITDAQIGLFVSQADAVVIGADSLLPDGSLVNKAGSYPLALAARDQGVPFYVCCESFKRRSEAMGVPELEAMDATELDGPELSDVQVQNIYFDITPARLISAWFDEKGMHPNPHVGG
jgi:translation initiation factor eIF-2B subunit delta